MWLDLVKERLTEKVYTVTWFVRDMRLIFRNHKTFYKVKGMSCFLLTSFLLSPNFWDPGTLQELCADASRRGLQKTNYRRKPSAFQGWMSERAASRTGKLPCRRCLKKICPQSPTGRLLPLESLLSSLLVQTERKGSVRFHCFSCLRNTEISE